MSLARCNEISIALVACCECGFRGLAIRDVDVHATVAHGLTAGISNDPTAS